MPFPAIQRVRYSKSPLENVICQLRFPPILMIDSETPSKFQNEIRDSFPIYEENFEIQQEFEATLNLGNVAPISNPMSSISQTRNFVFKSEDGMWQINLTRTFISLSTRDYSTWDNFLSKFKEPLRALNSIYKPAFYTRIGLRYVDVFDRSLLNLTNVPWSDLIKSEFLGLLGSSIVENIKECSSNCNIFCDDKETMLRVMTNLVTKIGSNEQCFLMDCDVFSGKVVLGKEIDKLNYMHDRASRLLHFAITTKLHESMEPEDL